MKKLILLLLIFTMILTTACWDMIEINDRVFPYTVGIDPNYEGEKDFLITFSYPNINALGNNATSDEKVFMITDEADNLFESTHNLSTRIQQPIYLKHLKVLVVSEEIAKESESMKGIIDGLNRDFIINKMVDLVVVKDNAEKLIETKINSTRQESIEGVLYSILKNEQDSTRFTPKGISEFVGDMDRCSATIVPLSKTKGDEIVVSGGAIFQDYKLKGYVSGKENKDIALLNGQIRHDGIDIDFRDKSLSILIVNQNNKKKLIEKENIKIKYSIEIEGQIQQYTIINETSDEESEVIIRDMEKAVEDTIEESLRTTIERLQKDIKADVIGVAKYLQKFYPKLWNEVKDDWDTIFPNITIEPEVKMHIRRRGLVR